ncbi:hypothetical protein BJV78DRAFT_810118 [Lactifluus subvellereus]|nr:hypothetical protein BJV78DRAFT_810118 [Lactifluus subvellereus]
MFKRVDRRRKRKEQEESLGLDEDEREVLGLHDTDSSESESDSSESSSTSLPTTSSDGRGPHPGHKRKRRVSLLSHDENEESKDGELITGDELEGDEDDGDSDYETNPPLTISSALREPIRLIRQHPEAWVCAFCPNKTLKHMAMVKVHEASRIHRQRLKRIQELAMEFNPNDDIQNLLVKLVTGTQPEGEGTTLSRRAELRRAKQAKLKERRKKIKEKKAAGIAIAKAKKAAKTAKKETISEPTSDADGAAPPPKRVKVASSEAPEGISMHRTSSLEAEKGKLTKVASKRREAMKSHHIPGKRKKPRTDGGAMLA